MIAITTCLWRSLLSFAFVLPMKHLVSQETEVPLWRSKVPKMYLPNECIRVKYWRILLQKLMMNIVLSCLMLNFF